MSADRSHIESMVADARPAPGFAAPPYRAELLSAASAWAGLMNASGFNCLTFRGKPGAVITNLDMAHAIAEKWNKEASHG